MVEKVLCPKCKGEGKELVWEYDDSYRGNIQVSAKCKTCNGKGICKKITRYEPI